MEEHVYPGELVILMAFMLGPPLLLASAGQFWFLRRHGIPASRAWLSLLPTVAASIIVTTALFFFASRWLPRTLGLQDLFLGPMWFPILPLAFVVVALVSPAVSFWVGRRV